MANLHEPRADRAERGAMREAIGKLTGNTAAEAEGRAEQQSPKSDAKPGSARTP